MPSAVRRGSGCDALRMRWSRAVTPARQPGSTTVVGCARRGWPGPSSGRRAAGRRARRRAASRQRPCGADREQRGSAPARAAPSRGTSGSAGSATASHARRCASTAIASMISARARRSEAEALAVARPRSAARIASASPSGTSSAVSVPSYAGGRGARSPIARRPATPCAAARRAASASSSSSVRSSSAASAVVQRRFDRALAQHALVGEAHAVGREHAGQRMDRTRASCRAHRRRGRRAGRRRRRSRRSV